MRTPPNLVELFSIAEKLRGTILRASTVSSLREQLLPFLSGYIALGIERSSHQVWYRARRCPPKVGHVSLSDMIYPPNGSADFGRAHLPGTSVLYASWNIPTALDEIGAQAGEWIQVIALRPIAGVSIPCHVVGEYQSFYSSGHSLLRSDTLESYLTKLQAADEPRFRAYVFVDSVLSELFHQPAKRPFEYKLTAVFADRLHQAKGGLIYPSVETSGGMNLAVPAATFDSQFEVILTQVLNIQQSFGYGLYEVSKARQSCGFEVDGRVNWDSSKRRNFTWSPAAGIQEAEPWPGWQNPP